MKGKSILICAEAFSQRIWLWLGVLLLCLSLNAGAVFYQHVLNHEPCELCIYVRVWLFSIALVALIGIFVKKVLSLRVVLSVLGLLLSLGLSFETWNLIVVEYAIGHGGTCSFFANFPTWLPLDKWLPSVFEVRGFCQATPVVLLGISMAHVLTVVSLSLVSFFAAIGAANILRMRA